MRKMNKLFVLIGLITILLIAAGCANDGNSKKTGSNEPNNNGSNESNNPTDVKLVLYNSSDFPDGQDENNNPYLENIEMATNLNIKVETPPSANYDERLNIIMTGNDLPDMIHSRNANWYVDFVRQNAFTPLKAILEEHGQNLLELIPDDAWQSVSIDGEYYAVPYIGESLGYELPFVRKDMLDDLGLDIPVTLDDFVDVTRKFKEEYDTVGILATENAGLLTPIYGAFGVQPGQWKEVDGELVYASTLPETKEALEFLADLYDEGLLDKEFTSNATEIFNEKLANDKSGLYFGGWTSLRSALKTNMENNENAEWIPIDYPVGPNGDSGPAATQFVIGYNAIPVTSDNAVEIIKMLDYIVSDGFKEIYFGIEGDVWTEEDGEFVTDFDKHNEQIYRQMYRMIAPFDEELIKIRLDSLGEEFLLNDNITKINENVQLDDYKGPPTHAETLYAGQLKQLQEEYFVRIIAGVDPIDKFDEYVERWYKEGGQEWTDEVNDWAANN